LGRTSAPASINAGPESRLDAMPSARAGVVVVAACFVLSRIAYFALGVRFDALPLDFFMQYPDPLLLRTDLLRTSYYFHMTPPAYNVFLGIVLKVFGAHYWTALHAVYLLAGLFLAVSLYLLMRSLGASQLPSILFTIIFVVSPATVLYENWLYPDYLIAALLPFMVWLLGRAVKQKSMPSLVAFFSLAALIVLSRSFYHLGWLILAVALVLLIDKGWRSRILIAAAVPVLLCASLYVKNYAVFGFVSGSSAYGAQAYYGTTLQLTPSEIQQLYSEGKISKLGFDLDGWYADHPGLLNPGTGVPTLDEPLKSTGAPNWNNRGYVEVWNQYARDAVATVKARPTVVLRAVRMGLLILFVPSDEHDFSAANHAHLASLERIVDVGLYGQPRLMSSLDPAAFRGGQVGERLREVGWLIVLAYVIALAYGVYMLRALLKQRGRPDRLLMVAFILFTICYIVAVDVPFGIPDNNRYRFMADPLVTALLAVALTALVARVRRAVTRPGRRGAAG
jgi:Dolichyl-phosphate-mannose-protein mannosyltransferase